VNVLRPFHGLRSFSIPRDVSRLSSLRSFSAEPAALTRWLIEGK
jgi:hypothetical protein